MLRKFLSRRREDGFTIPELLVVATIMILLTVIAVPIVSSQRSKVNEGELKSDLANAAINVEEAKVDNGGKYPETLPTTVKLASDTATLHYTYPYDRLQYCLQIVSGETTLFKTNSSSEITTTDCTYEYVVPSTKLSGRMNGFAPVLSWNTVANATSYVIYKNNIPVKTVTISAGSTAKTTSYTLPAMNPLEDATFHIVVADGGSQSAQSNSVRLKAPIPTPTKPTIKEVSKSVKDATTMSFTVGWNAIKYAKSYELYDVTGTTPVKLDTLGESAGSAKVEIPRGTMRKVVLRSVNEAGASGDSNVLTLSSAWDPAKIVSATSDPATGKIKFVFHEDKNGTITPDYGWPTSSIRLKVSEVASGLSALDVSNIKTMEYTGTKVFNRVQHRATIIATTSTGTVLSESAPIIIDFPKPTTPSSPQNFTSTNGGDAAVTPNRLKWSAVTCSPSSTAEYFIEHDGFNSGWMAATTFNIPASWLAQGAEESFKIKARCVNANGISGESAQSSTNFTTGLSTPETPADLNAPNRGNVATWSAVVCAPGSTVEYGIKQSIRNDANTNYSFSPLKTPTHTLTSLTPGTDQNFSVAARCVQYDGAGAVKASSSWSPYSGYYKWTTKFSAPAVPVLTQVSKSYPTSTTVEFRIRWSADQWARMYHLYDAKDNRTATIDGGTLETVVTGTRGENMSVYLVATNPDYTSAPSAKLALNDVWAKTAILETTADPYSGSINVVWQTKDTNGAVTPDWGGVDSRAELSFTDTVTGEVVTYENLEGVSLDSDELSRNPQTIKLVIKTSTGVVLSPPATKLVTFPKPGPPAKVTNVRITSNGNASVTPNQIVWTAVSCGRATPEYLITDANSGNSGWIEGIVSETNDDIVFNPDDEWLKQGFTENFTIIARCQNPAGPSDPSPSVSTSFVVDVNTPDALDGVTNNKIDLVKWSHAEAPSGLTREYQVSTKTFNGVASTNVYTTANDSYLVTGLAPNKTQLVEVRVRFYNAATNKSSAWSAASNTTWVTPKPIPGIPVATLDSSVILNATTQRYKISWAATTWAEGYRVIDNEEGKILATTTGLTANVDLMRGINPLSVSVEAFNTSATSALSNELTLEAPWEDPEFKSITANRNGTVALAWQTGTVAAPTPDWGAPNTKVKLEIRKESEEGAVVYTVSNLNSINHTTTAFANTSALRDEDYYAQITVTTSTGKAIQSSWTEIGFERPNSPAHVSNIRIDGSGVTSLPQDRVLWNAVTCTQSASAPEYWVGYVPSDLDADTVISDEAVQAMGWTKNVTSFNITLAKLLQVQGEDLSLVVLSRCAFTDNGDVSEPRPAVVDGNGYLKVTIGIAPPTKNPGVPTRANVLNNTINWSAATCNTGSTPEYQILKNVHNGVNSTATYTTAAISYALPSITAGANQSVQVQARCILTADTSKVSSWSSYSAAYAYRAPLAKPAAPVIKSTAISYTADKTARYTVSWAAVTNAENYLVYNGTTLLATLTPTQLTYNVDLNRGSEAAKNITVKATNFSYAAAAVASSNLLTLDAPWPDADIISVTANQNRQLTIEWQTGTGISRDPNWGNNASKVQVIVAEGTVTKYTVSNLTTNNHQTTALPGTASKFNVTIKVTTANGEILTSPVFLATLNPPLKPTTTMVITSANAGAGPIFKNKLSWTHVTCPTVGSSPEYLISHTDADFGNKTGTWITTNAFDIPQSWLQAGVVQEFTALARCSSDNGVSPNATAVKHSFTTNVPTPAKVVNLTLDSDDEKGNASLSWDAITCPSHLDAGYMVVFDKKNDVAYADYAASNAAKATVHVSGNTSVNLTGLTPGGDQSVNVLGRCYDVANSAITSTWENATKSNSVAWTSQIPVPAKPTLTVSGIQTNPSNEKQTQGTLTWNMPANTAKMKVYTSTGTLIGTYTGTTLTQFITRGTSTSYYVVPENALGNKGQQSANVTISSTWPNIVLSQTGFNTTTGSWAAKWATAAQNPDWGTGAKFSFVVKNASGTVIENTTGLAYTVLNRTIDLPDAPSTYSMTVTVTTTTGVVKTSNVITTKYVKPPAAPTGLTTNSHTGIKWSAVSCVSGSTPVYHITWNTQNGVAGTNAYTTTATSYSLPGMTPAKAQKVTVKALCRNTVAGDSIYSAGTALSFTSFYAIPTGVAAPATADLTSAGPSNKTELDRLTWTHATCPTGATRSYTITWTHSSGDAGTFYTKSGITGNYYDLTAGQQQAGSRVSWGVVTKCEVDLGTGSSASKQTGWHVASIDQPSGNVNNTNNGWMTVSWNGSMTCPDAGTSIRTRWRITYINSVDSDNYWTDWSTNSSGSRGYRGIVPEANYGYKHGAYIGVACAYDNNSGGTSYSAEKQGEQMYWTANMNDPVIANGRADRSDKEATFNLTCDRGTYFKYRWEAKNSAGSVVQGGQTNPIIVNTRSGDTKAMTVPWTTSTYIAKWSLSGGWCESDIIEISKVLYPEWNTVG